jgi:anti-repressor protein
MEDKDLIVLLQKSQNNVVELQNAIDGLLKQNATLEAEVETWQMVTDSNDKVEMSVVAKMLNYDNVGRNKLFNILRGANILRYNNEPYQRFIDAGHFGIIEQEVSTSFGNTIINKKTIVTQKGIDYIRKTLDKLGYKRSK